MARKKTSRVEPPEIISGAGFFATTTSPICSKLEFGVILYCTVMSSGSSADLRPGPGLDKPTGHSGYDPILIEHSRLNIKS